MSQLSELTGAGNSAVLPEYIISPFRLVEYGEAEEEFSRRHLAVAGASVVGLPAEVGDSIIRAAMDVVKLGWFNWGRPGFDARARASSSLPYLLWLSIRIKNPKVIRAQAVEMITAENEADVSRAVMEAIGYRFGDQSKNVASPVTAGDQPIGSTSTPPSAPKDEPQLISA